MKSSSLLRAKTKLDEIDPALLVELTPDLQGRLSRTHEHLKALEIRAARLVDREELRETPSKYLDLFGLSTAKQKEIIESIFKHVRTYVKSCNDVGKTYTAAVGMFAFLDIHRPSAKVITTSKSFDAVKLMLWTRIRELHGYIKDRFGENQVLNLTEFFPDRNRFPDWFAVGYNPKIEKTTEGGEAVAFSGHHTDHLLFIVDEAITTDKAIWSAIEGSLLSEGSSLLAIYNPTTKSGEVYQAEKRKLGNLIHISAYDLFNDETWKANREAFRGLASPDRVQAMIDKYGENHPIVRARIFGEYPEQDEKSAIKLQAIQDAQDRMETLALGDIEQRIFSYDVAGEGDDSNVVGELVCGSEGLRYLQVDKWDTGDHADSLKRVAGILRDSADAPKKTLVVDTVGEGSHVPALLKDQFPDVRFKSFKSGEKAKVIPERKEMVLFNKVSEAWYRAHLLIENKVTKWKPIAIDLNPELEGQLSNRRYEHKKRNNEPLVWMIESKADYKERATTGSPDEADAFVMAVHAYFDKGSIGGGAISIG